MAAAKVDPKKSSFSIRKPSGSLREYQLPKRGGGGLRKAIAGALKDVAVGATYGAAKDVLQATAGLTTGAHSIRTKEDLLGRSRKAAGTMALTFTPTGKAARVAGPIARLWAKPLKGGKGVEYTGLRPARRVPTEDPRFEITHAREGEDVVGLAGAVHPWKPGEMRKEYQDDIRHWQRILRETPDPARLSGMERRLAEQQRQQARFAINLAQERLRFTPPEWAFNVVEAGTKKPHATIKQSMGRGMTGETYIDEASNLRELQLGTHGMGTPVAPERWWPGTHIGAEVPPGVMRQLLVNAMSPEKPVSAAIINPRLSGAMTRLAREHGVRFTDEGMYAGMDAEMIRDAIDDMIVEEAHRRGRYGPLMSSSMRRPEGAPPVAGFTPKASKRAAQAAERVAQIRAEALRRRQR